MEPAETRQPSPSPGPTEPEPGVHPVRPDVPEAERSGHRRGAWVALLVLVVGVVGLEARFRGSRLADALAAESPYIHKARAYALSEGSDIAITGDSRILHGFYPLVVADVVEEERGERPRVYNAGLSGAPPMAQLAWVRRLLTHPGRRPKVVVLGISPYMFSSRIARVQSRESLTTMWRLEDLGAAVRAGAGLEELSTLIVTNLFESVRLRPRVVDVVLKGSKPGVPAELGEDGYVRMWGVDPATQASRAHHRGLAYRGEMWKPGARLGNEQMGYFLEALRELRDAGVSTFVINTPSASQVDTAYGPESIYDEHVAWVKEQAAKYGATYVDLKRVPGIADVDFSDGDHLSVQGAVRFSEHLAREYILPALGGSTFPGAECRSVFTFDAAELTEWTLQGEAMQVQTGPTPAQQPITGQRGSSLLNSFTAQGDASVGEALSPPFVLEGAQMRLRVGGGGEGKNVGVELLVEGQVQAQTRGRDTEHLGLVAWDVSAMRGRSARLRIRDAESGPWGHILVDDVKLCP
jgi:hypothetical protein